MNGRYARTQVAVLTCGVLTCGSRASQRPAVRTSVVQELAQPPLLLALLAKLAVLHERLERVRLDVLCLIFSGDLVVEKDHRPVAQTEARELAGVVSRAESGALLGDGPSLFGARDELPRARRDESLAAHVCQGVGGRRTCSSSGTPSCVEISSRTAATVAVASTCSRSMPSFVRTRSVIIAAAARTRPRAAGCRVRKAGERGYLHNPGFAKNRQILLSAKTKY